MSQTNSKCRKIALYFPCCNIGDLAFLISEIHGICNHYNISSITICSPSKHFYIHSRDDYKIIDIDTSALKILNACSLVNAVIIDDRPREFIEQDYDKLIVPVIEKELIPKTYNFKDYIDLKDYIPINLIGKVAIFQPISLSKKPEKYRELYVMHWDKSIEALLDNGYSIYMTGGGSDRNDLERTGCINKSRLKYINDFVDKWNILETLALIIHRADFVIGCDSWAGVFGVSCRVPTCQALGYRMENGIDTFLLDYLGNKDVYCMRYSSKAAQADADFAGWINAWHNSHK